MYCRLGELLKRLLKNDYFGLIFNPNNNYMDYEKRRNVYNLIESELKDKINPI